jgi:hypothetical protein
MMIVDWKLHCADGTTPIVRGVEILPGLWLHTAKGGGWSNVSHYSGRGYIYNVSDVCGAVDYLRQMTAEHGIDWTADHADIKERHEQALIEARKLIEYQWCKT